MKSISLGSQDEIYITHIRTAGDRRRPRKQAPYVAGPGES